MKSTGARFWLGALCWLALSATGARADGLGASNAIVARLAWRAVIGQGFSGFAIAQDRAFTLCQRSMGVYLTCLDMAGGRTVWDTRLGMNRHVNDDFPGPYAAPTVDSGRVFCVDCSGRIACADAASGELIWTLDLAKKVGMAGADFGYSCPPLAESNRVFLTAGAPGASVVALDARTGGILWTNGQDRASYAPCALATVEGHRQVVAFLEESISGFDPGTGALLWREDLATRGYAQHCARPLFEAPFLFCSSAFRQGARTLRLGYRDGRAVCDPVWQSLELSQDILPAALADGYVYGFDVQSAETRQYGGTKGEFKCLELATGNLMWRSKSPGHASASLWAGKLALLNENGELILIEASSGRYRELCRCQAVRGRLPCWTAPAFDKDRVIIRNQEAVACYQVGPASSAPPTPNLGRPESLAFLLAQDWLTWAQKHQSRAFWNPRISDLARWYLWSAALLAASAGLTLTVRGKLDRLTVLRALCAVLGALAMPLASFGTGALVFTWPLACHALLALTIQAGKNLRPLAGRLVLLLFLCACVPYALICRRLQIDCGIGFLAGLGLALPFALARTSGAPRPSFRQFLWRETASFSAYYWACAAFIRAATH